MKALVIITVICLVSNSAIASNFPSAISVPVRVAHIPKAVEVVSVGCEVRDSSDSTLSVLATGSATIPLNANREFTGVVRVEMKAFSSKKVLWHTWSCSLKAYEKGWKSIETLIPASQKSLSSKGKKPEPARAPPTNPAHPLPANLYVAPVQSDQLMLIAMPGAYDAMLASNSFAPLQSLELVFIGKPPVKTNQ